jgi:hypothetical protein
VTFAIITCALLSGAVADRIRTRAWVAIVIAWSTRHDLAPGQGHRPVHRVPDRSGGRDRRDRLGRAPEHAESAHEFTDASSGAFAGVGASHMSHGVRRADALQQSEQQ